MTRGKLADIAWLILNHCMAKPQFAGSAPSREERKAAKREAKLLRALLLAFTPALAYKNSMKRLDAPLVSLIGFAAAQWAEEQTGNGHNGGKHKRRLRQLVIAGLELHTRSELYAAAPDLLRSLQTVASHASIALQLTNDHEMPKVWTQDPRQSGRRRNGQQGRNGQGTKQGKKQ
jgi:hypothetical protein